MFVEYKINYACVHVVSAVSSVTNGSYVIGILNKLNTLTSAAPGRFGELCQLNGLMSQMWMRSDYPIDTSCLDWTPYNITSASAWPGSVVVAMDDYNGTLYEKVYVYVEFDVSFRGPSTGSEFNSFNSGVQVMTVDNGGYKCTQLNGPSFGVGGPRVPAYGNVDVGEVILMPPVAVQNTYMVDFTPTHNGVSFRHLDVGDQGTFIVVSIGCD
jgi:hypothetical protein